EIGPSVQEPGAEHEPAEEGDPRGGPQKPAPKWTFRASNGLGRRGVRRRQGDSRTYEPPRRRVSTNPERRLPPRPDAAEPTPGRGSVVLTANSRQDLTYGGKVVIDGPGVLGTTADARRSVAGLAATLV